MGMRILTLAFLGRLLATTFVALCIALGFGPDKWAAALIGAQPPLIVWAVRGGFLLLGAITFVCALWPTINRFWIGHHRPDMTIREAIDWIAYRSRWGWKRYGEWNWFNFVADRAPRELQKAAQDGLITIRQRPYGGQVMKMSRRMYGAVCNSRSKII